MPKRVSDYYYIFDGRSGRSVIVDRKSGTPAFERENDTSEALKVARYVANQQSEMVLRAFACWCATQTWPEKPPSDFCCQLWDAAQGVVLGQCHPKAMERAREASDDAAVGAAAIGLPRKMPGAAQLLAARSCTEPNVYAAAYDAMHMSLRWAEFISPDNPGTAIDAMHTRQVNALLDALNQEAPF